MIEKVPSSDWVTDGLLVVRISSIACFSPKGRDVVYLWFNGATDDEPSEFCISIEALIAAIEESYAP